MTHQTKNNFYIVFPFHLVVVSSEFPDERVEIEVLVKEGYVFFLFFFIPNVNQRFLNAPWD